jgi:hypothetical protein
MTLGSGNTNGVCPLKLRVPERPIRLRIGRGGTPSREARNLRLPPFGRGLNFPGDPRTAHPENPALSAVLRALLRRDGSLTRLFQA